MTVLTIGLERSQLEPNTFALASRRRGIRSLLLCGTAIVGGASALVTGTPQNAAAACVVGASSVVCGATTTTNTTFNANAPNDRNYAFGVPSTVTGSSSGTVDGFGLAVSNSSGGVDFANSGLVGVNAGNTPSAGGNAALNLTSTGGGVISYTGGGTVTATTNAIPGLVLNTNGSGTINIGSSSTPVPGGTFQGTYGIVTGAAAGSTVVYLSGGSVVTTGAGTDAIHSSSTTGDVGIFLTGQTSITNTQGAGVAGGVFGIGIADNAGGVSNGFGGNATIVSNANIGGTGAAAFTTGMSIGTPGGNISGNVNVTLTGGTINYQNFGLNIATAGAIGIELDSGNTFASNSVNSNAVAINAVTSTGTINVVTNNGSAITGTAGTGINAISTGATGGSIAVSVNGSITHPNAGVNAQISNAANASTVQVSAGANSAITANNIGINAATAGTGAVNVTTSNGSVINQGTNGGVQNTTPAAGILTSSASGTTVIDVGGIIRANNDAINAAATAGGDISITTRTGSVTGDANNTGIGGNGIVANATGGNGAINIATGSGLVQGSNFGIRATAVGTGNVTIGVDTGGVNATSGAAFGNAGVSASAAAGNILTNTTGTVASENDAIVAKTTAGGSIQITTAGAVTGDVSGGGGGGGILAQAVGGGNSSITTGSGLVSGGVLAPTAGFFNSIIGATADGAGAVNVTLGSGGLLGHTPSAAGPVDGIRTSAVNGATNIIVNGAINVMTAASGSGVNASATGAGTISITNNSTITGFTAGVSASSPSSVTITNNSGAVIKTAAGITGQAISGTGGGNFGVSNAGTIIGNADIGNGSNSFVNQASGTFNMGATVNVGAANTLTNAGTVSPGGSGTILTTNVTGKLAFNGSSTLAVDVSATAADRINVSGTATLGGGVAATFTPGSYVVKQYTILHSAGLGGSTFNTLSTSNQPSGFKPVLSYSSTDAFLNLIGTLGSSGGLGGNNQSVSNALNNFFNNGGVLPPNFLTIFGLNGNALTTALSQLSGEVATDSERGSFQMMTSFLGNMLDPFVDGRRGVGGRSTGFAPEEQASLPPEIAQAYNSVTKATQPVDVARNWNVWGVGYGGSNTTKGLVSAGTNDVTTTFAGFSAGVDFRVSDDTIAGFALGGGGMKWNLAQGLGTGRSDAFQAGLYSKTYFGPVYVAAAVAAANQWMTTNRAAPLGDQLTASFNGQSYGGRIESGWRYAAAPTLGITPYGAIQVQKFYTPSYSENDVTGGGFALAYNGRSATDTRAELGARFDDLAMLGNMPLILRARLAWAHDWVNNPALGAAFQVLPGSSFTVNGATPPKNSALVSAGGELRITPSVSLAAKFDGEFASGSQTYAGTGTLRYTW